MNLNNLLFKIIRKWNSAYSLMNQTLENIESLTNLRPNKVGVISLAKLLYFLLLCLLLNYWTENGCELFSNSFEYLLEDRRVFNKVRAYLGSLWWNIVVRWLDVVQNPFFKVGRNWDQNRIQLLKLVFTFLLLRSSKLKMKNIFLSIKLGTWIDKGDRVGSGTETINGLSSGPKPSWTFILTFYYL